MKIKELLEYGTSFRGSWLTPKGQQVLVDLLTYFPHNK